MYPERSLLEPVSWIVVLQGGGQIDCSGRTLRVVGGGVGRGRSVYVCVSECECGYTFIAVFPPPGFASNDVMSGFD